MKNVNNLKGMHGVGSMLSRKKRSIPDVQTSTYLDLYMLDKEKERLLKEGGRLSMRQDCIRKRLEEIEFEMNKMQKVEAASKAGEEGSSPISAAGQTNDAKSEFKTMALSY